MRCKILHILMTATLVSISIPGHSQLVPLASEGGYGRKEPRRQNDLKVERAYTERRWIGLLSNKTAECPAVSGWELETLEDQVLSEIGETLKVSRTANPDHGYPSGDLPEPAVDRKLLDKLGLDRYCIYTSSVPGMKFDRPDGLAEAERDRLALSITSAGGSPSDALGQRIWPTLAEHFRDHTGQVTSSGHPALGFTGGPSVRLTFIDSQPDGEWPPAPPVGNGSRHGFTLVHMARGLVCPGGGSCAADIVTRRALLYKDFNPADPLPPLPRPGRDQSGHVGLVSDLAATLYSEVLYWRRFEPERKLIINLSLGWDGEAFGDLEARSVSELEPSVRAVYNALRFARRSGALVIAAAGNQRGGGGTEWPLLPAAWELRRPNWLRWAFCRKPVYAVGGVESQGLPIPNSRAGGRPRRAAYADHSVTSAESPDIPTAMYTGTSVSAAVTSSIAAVVWHLRPELRPAQLMRLLARSGDELDFRADFHEWKPLSMLVRAPYARRLSLCPAVAEACRPGKRCDALASAPKCPAWDERLPNLQEPLAGLLGIPAKLTPVVPSDEPVDVASQRWVIPQPEATPCPGCAVVSKPPPEGAVTGTETETEYVLNLQIGEDWKQEAQADSLDLDSGKLVITCGTVEVFSRSLPLETLDAGGPSVPGPLYEMIINAGRSFEGCTAQITYMVTKPGESPMTVKNPVSLSSSSL